MASNPDVSCLGHQIQHESRFYVQHDTDCFQHNLTAAGGFLKEETSLISAGLMVFRAATARPA
jgi:hypothetical protein